MSVLRQVASELYSMFVGDAALSIGAVAIVLVAYALRTLTAVPPTLLGFVLLAVCAALLIWRVFAFTPTKSSQGCQK